MSSFFLDAYLEKIQNSFFIPRAKEDLDMMLRTYLLEGVIHDLNFELNNRPEYLIVPLRLIHSIMDTTKDKAKKIPPVVPEG
jgi:maltose alpha-D-glucosyltransferase/alpha-amylase